MMKENIFKEMIKFYEENRCVPTIRFLMKSFDFKSTGSIYYYLKLLEKDGYIKRNKYGKYFVCKEFLSDVKNINIINCKESVNIKLKREEKYIGYKVKNNKLKMYNIVKGDILIIKQSCKVDNEFLGLFIIDNEYRVMKCKVIDNYYMLNDDEQIITNSINMIGKVEYLERKIKKG